MIGKGIQPLAISALFHLAVLLSAQDTRAPVEAASEADALVKATQNPIASLASVPPQNNSNFAVVPYNRTQDVLNVQPVIPIRISENWFFIARVIQPAVWQPTETHAGGELGFGDMNPTLFALSS